MATHSICCAPFRSSPHPVSDKVLSYYHSGASSHNDDLVKLAKLHTRPTLASSAKDHRTLTDARLNSAS